jgi:lysophospholipase L1-like esterase
MNGVLRAPRLPDDTAAPTHRRWLWLIAIMVAAALNGSRVQVRQSDGAHFTAYGASQFARAVANGVG